LPNITSCAFLMWFSFSLRVTILFCTSTRR